MFEPLLAMDEIERAGRFAFRHLRESFVIARGTLRLLLGRYSNCPPNGVRFSYSSSGKPALESASGIVFNMANSGGSAVVAITTGCQIGVDLEQIRPVLGLEQVVRRFCPEEAAEILSLQPSERKRAFFACWTRKEAYVKAIGDGLSVPLDSFRVPVQPDTPACLLHIGHDTAAAKAWTMHDLCVAPDYAAALAYCERPRTLSQFPIVDLAEFFRYAVNE